MKFLPLILSILLFTTSCAVLQAKSDSGSVDPDAFASIHIMGGEEDMPPRAICSGFFLAADLVLTAEHCIIDGYDLLVGNRHSDSTPAEVVAVDSERDIALLRINSTSIARATLNVDNFPVAYGGQIRVMGTPFAFFDHRTGVIPITLGLSQGYDAEGDFHFNASIRPGSSGGPVLNEKGQVISIVSRCWVLGSPFTPWGSYSQSCTGPSANSIRGFLVDAFTR